MKYIITDQNEARIGNGYHSDLAEDCNGKVIRAGHCKKLEDGSYEVWGKSIGYNIDSQKEDATLLTKILNL